MPSRIFQHVPIQWLTKTLLGMPLMLQPLRIMTSIFVKRKGFLLGPKFQDGHSIPFHTIWCIWYSWGLQRIMSLHAWKSWSFGDITMKKVSLMICSWRRSAMRWNKIAKENGVLMLFWGSRTWYFPSKFTPLVFQCKWGQWGDEQYVVHSRSGFWGFRSSCLKVPLQ